MELDDMDLIASRTRSRKRKRSQMEGDSEDEHEVTFDVLKCFPRLVCQHIFQHLDKNELLEMSTVSTNWNDFVGERPTVGKLRLVIDYMSQHKWTKKAKHILEKTSRKYQNIRISFYPSERDVLLAFLAERAGFWKDVELTAEEAFPDDLWPEILKIVESSVEKLTICDRRRTIEASTAVDPNWKFPCLKRLDCGDVTYHNIIKYFVGAKSLVTFSWCWRDWNEEHPVTDIQEILRNNHQLVEMGAECHWRLFDHLSNTKFQLQELNVKILGQGGPTAAFISFLKSQAPTLVSLGVNLQADQALLELIFTLPRLTKLTTELNMDEEVQELPENTTITFYEVVEKIYLEYPLISAMSGLKHFKTVELDDAILAFLAEAVPDLESITTFYFHVYWLPAGRAFPKMKDFSIGTIGEGYKTPKGSSKFAKLVKKAIKPFRQFYWGPIAPACSDSSDSS